MAKKIRNNIIDYIELPSTSIEVHKKTKDFYKNIFGWSYKDWGEDYADTKDSGTGSGINADPDNRPAHPLIVIYVIDIEDAKAKIVSEGSKITRDIFSFPGGRRFHFKDPAGNELAVWSDK